MSYPAISPCAMAPIVHAASRRRARLASSADHPENGSDVRALSVAASGRYRGTPEKSMLEMQPVNVEHNQKSPSAVRTLSGMDTSMESSKQQNFYRCDNVKNYNYPHLVQLSPPASASECIKIDHNGNNENCHPYYYQNRCSNVHHTDNYRCNTCKLQQETSDLCANTSLSSIVIDDPDDMILTILSLNESGVDEMAEADQDINVFAGREKRNEDGLLERGCEFGAQRYNPEVSVSALHSEMVSCIADEHAEVQPDTSVVYSRSSSTISPTTASSTEMTSQTLSDAHTKPGMDKQHSLVEIGRCSIYLDTQTGEYHSMVYGSFPSDGNCSLNTMKEESGRHKSSLDSNEDLLFLQTQSAGSCSLPNMSTLQLSSHTSTAMDTPSHVCVSLKRSYVGGSVNDSEQCCECERSFEDDYIDHVRAPGRHLTMPGHQNMGRDSGEDQLVHTYPGAVACKPEATRRIWTQVSKYECHDVKNMAKDSDGEQLVHTYPGSDVTRRTWTQVSTCECKDIKNLSTLTHFVDKNGTVCQRCCVNVPSHSVSEDHPTIIRQTNSSPTYFPQASPSTQHDDPDNATKNAGNLQGSNVSDTDSSFSQSNEQKGQNHLQFSTKHNSAISSMSSMFRNIFPGKTRDKSRTNKDSLDRQEHDLNNFSQSERQLGASSAPDNECYSGHRHLTEQTPAANNRQRSPRECSQEVCQNSNNRAVDTGSDQQTYTETMPTPGHTDDADENTEVKILELRRYRELKRNYVAYLCCPPDALTTFGLPFHRLLESWGLPIFIPERNLPASGPKYQNIAECVEDSCNGKVIVILSNTYATSDECLFLTYFAKTLDPDSRNRNIIPVLIDSGVEIPSVLRGLSLIKYNHLVRSGWLKEKLVKAIAA